MRGAQWAVGRDGGGGCQALLAGLLARYEIEDVDGRQAAPTGCSLLGPEPLR
jgi:hypothetical protein